MTEIELAKIIIYFFNDGYEIFCEVFNVDIIATCKPIMISIEVKTSLNVKVVEQAYRNLNIYHYSYIAVPKPKQMNFLEKVCLDYGIGIIIYDEKSDFVYIKTKPKLNRHVKYVEIDPIYKNFTAGAKSGMTMTLFKLTIENIVRYLERNGDTKLNKLLSQDHYHYSNIGSAKSSLIKWCNNGLIKEFEIKNGIIKLSDNYSS